MLAHLHETARHVALKGGQDFVQEAIAFFFAQPAKLIESFLVQQLRHALWGRRTGQEHTLQRDAWLPSAPSTADVRVLIADYPKKEIDLTR